MIHICGIFNLIKFNSNHSVNERKKHLWFRGETDHQEYC